MTSAVPAKKYDRHPKIREGVMIGAGAKILGNIEGEGAKIGSCSVVLQAVPSHTSRRGSCKNCRKTGTDKPSLTWIKGSMVVTQNFIHGDGNSSNGMSIEMRRA